MTKGDADDIQPAWSPDGKTVLFVRAHQGGKKLEPGDVWAIDVASGKETRLVENAFKPAWSPDGRFILFDRFRPQGGDIWLMEGFR